MVDPPNGRHLMSFSTFLDLDTSRKLFEQSNDWACNARPRHAVMFTRVPGRNLTLADATPAVYQRLGAISADLHQHASGWRKPAGFQRYRWDLESMLGPQARFGCWADHPGLTVTDHDLLRRAAESVSDRITRFSCEPNTIGLAHTDLHVLNLIVDGDDLWAIDFDDCGISWYLQDIAPALACFEHGPKVDELAEAWIDGYQRRRRGPLSHAELAALPDFVMLRRRLLLGWSGTHPLAQIPGIDRDIIEVTTTAAEAYLQVGSRPITG
jgi:Ser/Thr protein kinase RdoA (MazF antagonist)